MSKLTQKLRRMSSRGVATATMNADVADAVPAWIALIVLFIGLIMAALQFWVTYYLYTLQTGDCSCAKGQDLLALLVLSVVLLGLTFAPYPALQGLGMVAAIGFLFLGFSYMKKIENCGCAKTMKGPEALQALMYIRIGFMLLGVLVIVGAMAVLGKLLWK